MADMRSVRGLLIDCKTLYDNALSRMPAPYESKKSFSSKMWLTVGRQSAKVASHTEEIKPQQ